MKTLINIFLVFATALTLCAQEAEKPSFQWTPDYDKAIATAKAQNKYVMLLFTGSTWCPPCKYLEREILSKEGFKNYASKKLVCVMVDIKNSGPSNLEFAVKHNELMKEFGVRGFPTVFIINPDTFSKSQMFGLKYDNLTDFLNWIDSCIKEKK